MSFRPIIHILADYFLILFFWVASLAQFLGEVLHDLEAGVTGPVASGTCSPLTGILQHQGEVGPSPWLELQQG